MIAPPITVRLKLSLAADCDRLYGTRDAKLGGVKSGDLCNDQGTLRRIENVE
jgi:hypothetical protein